MGQPNGPAQWASPNHSASAASTFFPALNVLHAQTRAVGASASGMSVGMRCKVAAEILQAMVMGGKPGSLQSQSPTDALREWLYEGLLVAA